MTPLERARLSLTGLCLGDSFGARFFFGRGAAIEQMLARRAAPRPALAIFRAKVRGWRVE